MEVQQTDESTVQEAEQKPTDSNEATESQEQDHKKSEQQNETPSAQESETLEPEMKEQETQGTSPTTTTTEEAPSAGTQEAQEEPPAQPDVASSEESTKLDWKLAEPKTEPTPLEESPRDSIEQPSKPNVQQEEPATENIPDECPPATGLNEEYSDLEVESLLSDKLDTISDERDEMHEDAQAEAGDEGGAIEDTGSSLDSDFCVSESASTRRLRELRLDALEDVQICGQNRDSTQAARRLFTNMDLRGYHSSAEANFRSSGVDAVDWAGCSDESDSSQGLSTGSSGRLRQLNSRVLVCSLNINNNNNNNNNNNDNQKTSNLSDDFLHSSSGHSSAGSSELGPPRQTRPDEILYPLEQEEVKSCRLAFRENKRLIEARQQSSELTGTFPGEPQTLNAPAGQQHSLRFPQQAALEESQVCSHCTRRLYPMDRMELDFTRTRLDIHKSCFKCHVCGTLLRLETYAAIDAKLYCPVHAKGALPAKNHHASQLNNVATTKATIKETAQI